MNPKYSFKNDYSEGACPEVLGAMVDICKGQNGVYGDDDFSQKAQQLIKRQINMQHSQVHFVSGGTQANLIVLASLLLPYESIVAATTGHIAVHEAGAIEATGHKVCTIASKDGKLTPELVDAVTTEHTDEHMVRPRVVFISNTTEVGTVYTKKELEELSDYCRQHSLLLYLDGARLGSALMSEKGDLTMADIARLVDVFYIGGTKNGAFLGEAIVITNQQLQTNFRYHMKQRGALLAKGTIIGAQFAALFQNDTYYRLATHANKMAMKLADAFTTHGCTFLTPPVSNQIFPIVTNSLAKKLAEYFNFYEWKKIDDDYVAIRLVTSWATLESKVDELVALVT